MYYRTCPECGSNLDPGEQCDWRRMAEPVCRENKRYTG